ncbi:MAG: hypothetical protein QXD61_09855 [Candidatus Caldarchaeum sp.]
MDIRAREKKITAAVAAASLLAGLLIGFTAAPQKTATVTLYSIATVTSITEVPVKNRPTPFSASAQLACIMVNTTQPVEGCPEPSIKAVAVTVRFTEMGVRPSYIKPTGFTAIAPGLARNASVVGSPVDAEGKIVIMPGRFNTEVSALIPVVDLRSFVNWMRDVGRIAIGFEVVDERNQLLQTVMVEDVVVYSGAWSIEQEEG